MYNAIYSPMWGLAGKDPRVVDSPMWSLAEKDPSVVQES